MPYAKRRSYLAAAKSWKIRNMIEGYVHARLTFQQHWRPKASDHHLPSFEVFKKICDVLQNVKDDHHLIYRRAGAFNGRDERHKLAPGYAETAFINHVGLLFHKAMVGKELRYMLERYSHDERNWDMHFQEMQTSLARLEKLFEQGHEVMAAFVRSHSDNVLVLSFLLENQRTVAKCFGIRPSEVLRFLVDRLDPQQVYYPVAQYYFESGWYERAHEMAQKAVHKNPGDERAGQLLAQVESKITKQKRRSRAGAESGAAKALMMESDATQTADEMR